jgi:hypothetical protein
MTDDYEDSNTDPFADTFRPLVENSDVPSWSIFHDAPPLVGSNELPLVDFDDPPPLVGSNESPLVDSNELPLVGFNESPLFSSNELPLFSSIDPRSIWKGDHASEQYAHMPPVSCHLDHNHDHFQDVGCTGEDCDNHDEPRLRPNLRSGERSPRHTPSEEKEGQGAKRHNPEDYRNPAVLCSLFACDPSREPEADVASSFSAASRKRHSACDDEERSARQNKAEAAQYARECINMRETSMIAVARDIIVSVFANEIGDKTEGTLIVENDDPYRIAYITCAAYLHPSLGNKEENMVLRRVECWRLMAWILDGSEKIKCKNDEYKIKLQSVLDTIGRCPSLQGTWYERAAVSYRCDCPAEFAPLHARYTQLEEDKNIMIQNMANKGLLNKGRTNKGRTNKGRKIHAKTYDECVNNMFTGYFSSNKVKRGSIGRKKSLLKSGTWILDVAALIKRNFRMSTPVDIMDMIKQLCVS